MNPGRFHVSLSSINGEHLQHLTSQNNGHNSLINMASDDKNVYHNITAFIFTGQLPDRVSTSGINPQVDIKHPLDIGFNPADVLQYSYFFLFVMNLNHYSEVI
jgi:hypothetical protein